MRRRSERGNFGGVDDHRLDDDELAHHLHHIIHTCHVDLQRFAKLGCALSTKCHPWRRLRLPFACFAMRIPLGLLRARFLERGGQSCHRRAGFWTWNDRRRLSRRRRFFRPSCAGLVTFGLERREKLANVDGLDLRPLRNSSTHRLQHHPHRLGRVKHEVETRALKLDAPLAGSGPRASPSCALAPRYRKSPESRQLP